MFAASLPLDNRASGSAVFQEDKKVYLRMHALVRASIVVTIDRTFFGGLKQMNRRIRRTIGFFPLLLAILFSAGFASAQTTSFTYQGRLTDGGIVANGNYDLQFTLWDNLSGGAQIGSTQTVNTVLVVNGVFTITLDFGAG